MWHLRLPWWLHRLFHSLLCTALNGRHAVRAVQRDCLWGLKNWGNSHWSHEPIMQWRTRQSQSIFRSTNHKRVMPANNWSPRPIPTDSPIATKLGVCNSLMVAAWQNTVHENLVPWEYLFNTLTHWSLKDLEFKKVICTRFTNLYLQSYDNALSWMPLAFP